MIIVVAGRQYRLLLIVGLLGSIISFFLWIYATSFVPAPLGIILFYGCFIPLFAFGIIGYLCPISIEYDSDTIVLKTLLMKRKIPWSKISKAIFHNLLDDKGKIELDHPSFILLKTDHKFYRWYFVSRFLNGYNDLVNFMSLKGKLDKINHQTNQ